jgi:hypothetical protein
MLVFLLVIFLLYVLTGWKIFKTLAKIVAWVWLVVFIFAIGTGIGIFMEL